MVVYFVRDGFIEQAGPTSQLPAYANGSWTETARAAARADYFSRRASLMMVLSND